METLKITYSPFVLEETVTDFSAHFPLLYVITEVEPIEMHRSYVEHWAAKEVFDLVISFADPQHEFLRSVLKSVATDILKEAFKKAWHGLSKNKPTKDGSRSIEIDLTYKDVKASFRIQGNNAGLDIERCVNVFGDLMEKDQLVLDSKNPHFRKEGFEFEGVKYYYDSDTNLWAAHNFEKDKQEMYKRMRDSGH